MTTKKAILLITFGSSKPEKKKSLDNIEKLTRERFPNIEIRWGYTSPKIRRKLLRKGEVTYSPQLALAKLAEDGYTHVAVQSLQIVPGVEFDKLKSTINRASAPPALFTKIALGLPLLSDHKTTTNVMQYMLKQIPNERATNDGVILIGHGSEDHHSDLIYTAAAAIVNELDSNAFLGTIEGHNKINIILNKCKENGIKKAFLIPLMTVIGYHVQKDIAGNNKSSWNSILAKNGIECVNIMKGTADYDSIVNIWIDHLDKAISELEQ